MNLNCWLGCGRLTKDAELSTTKKGTSMSKFRLAVNDRRNDETLFVNVLGFGKRLRAHADLGGPSGLVCCLVSADPNLGKFLLLLDPSAASCPIHVQICACFASSKY